MEGEESEVGSSLNVEEGGRGCRSKKKFADPTFCPVCSVTLRPNEVDAHLSCELDKLYKLSWKPKNKHSLSPSTVENGNSENVDKSWEVFRKVRSNRQGRQKLKSRKRRFDEVICPVCNKETTEDISVHVDRCLRHSESNNGTESDENIDVGYEEYEWAGQSRVRATTMLGGSLCNIGTSLSMVDDDEDLVVDGDDTQVYGTPQYSEKDIILPGGQRLEQDPLRKAVIGENEKENEVIENGKRLETVQTKGDPIVQALKNRIHELESRESSKDEVFKCLICMERYKTPVISVCCWHVHCEVCWLQTLGAKKLCPQCNMITSPADLRRIYM